jgi:uncharacterized membrane protein YdjX (TVP38/TMEM64 family)
VVGVLLLAAIIALLSSGALSGLSAEEMKAQLLASGPWGPIGFVIAFGLLQPLGLSSHLFIVAAALVWGPVLGMSLSWLGILVGSTVAFVFARWMGRDWVQKRLPARLRRWDNALGQRGFRTVLVMRLLLFTFGPMQLMLGVSTVRFVPFFLGSALGVLPLLALESWVGAGVVQWLFRAAD